MLQTIGVLGLAVVFEVAWAVLLKLSAGFTVLWASGLMLIGYLASLLFLNLACQRLPISVAYPIWTGIGGTAVALIGVFAFDERMTWTRACGVALVVFGTVLVLACEARPSPAGGA
jgi:multidrug transporter EmrE-like cation transporter